MTCTCTNIDDVAPGKRDSTGGPDDAPFSTPNPPRQQHTKPDLGRHCWTTVQNRRTAVIVERIVDPACQAWRTACSTPTPCTHLPRRLPGERHLCRGAQGRPWDQRKCPKAHTCHNLPRSAPCVCSSLLAGEEKSTVVPECLCCCLCSTADRYTAPAMLTAVSMLVLAVRSYPRGGAESCSTRIAGLLTTRMRS